MAELVKTRVEINKCTYEIVIRHRSGFKDFLDEALHLDGLFHWRSFGEKLHFYFSDEKSAMIFKMKFG